jgi:hypothetical protein
MTNNSRKLPTFEKNWLTFLLSMMYPKHLRASNGRIFEVFAGVARFFSLFNEFFDSYIIHDINKNFLRTALCNQGRILRKTADRQNRLPIDEIYLMDGRNIEFYENCSVLVGFGCLGYFNDYGARRFLISAHGKFQNILLRESVLFKHKSSDETDIDREQ